MSESIVISPKYGVNPTMTICFFCSKPTGEIALLGHIKQRNSHGKAIAGTDIEAPREMVLNYEPCDECKAGMAQGITIIEVMETKNAPKNAMEICPGAVPTGKWSVIKEESFERIFKDILDSKIYHQTVEKRKCLLESQVYQYFFNQE